MTDPLARSKTLEKSNLVGKYSLWGAMAHLSQLAQSQRWAWALCRWSAPGLQTLLLWEVPLPGNLGVGIQVPRSSNQLCLQVVLTWAVHSSDLVLSFPAKLLPSRPPYLSIRYPSYPADVPDTRTYPDSSYPGHCTPPLTKQAHLLAPVSTATTPIQAPVSPLDQRSLSGFGWCLIFSPRSSPSLFFFF